MANKIYVYAEDPRSIPRVGPVPVQYWFHCPGCACDHVFLVGPLASGFGNARWNFNGDLERPTFKPSLLCDKDRPASRCHSIVTNGKIQFQDDCWHSLKRQTVELPDWES
jgi:hypothetical protein